MTVRAIDLFAGAGGFTEGAMAAGADVLWAANHWQRAVDVHASNHPGTDHACQDLQQADFTAVPEHDLLLASPACQGHSTARGADRPHHDAIRATAWAVIACVEAQLPQTVLVENVPQYRDWKLFPIWLDALRAYGYDVTVQVLNAADFGVPQARERLFVCANRGGAIELQPGTEEHRGLGEVVDFDAGRWSPVADKVQATRDQVARARAKHGDRCSIVYNGSRNAGRSLSQPCATVTTTDAIALVDGDRMRMLSVPEYQAAMGFRADYELVGNKKEKIKLLGNAVCPAVAEGLVNQVVAAR